MIMVVADASAIVAAMVEGSPRGVWASSALHGESIAGPEMLLAESSNVLRLLEQSGKVSRAEIAEAHRDLMRRDLQLHPFPPFAARVWELRHNLTAYDAWYVAVAESLDCPLVTLDRRLARSPGPACPILAPP